MRNLWLRAKALVARLFRRKPPEPGRFETGSASAFRGFLAAAPWIWPSRDYLVYVPRGHAGWGFRRRPLVVLLHGCRQTPEDFAAGTRVAAAADAAGCLILLPRQKSGANPWGCWNWFDPGTARGWGEAAIVAAQIRAVRRRYRVDKRRVAVAGMSSGAGLAAVMGVRHPELVAGVFAHSGVACGAASSPLAALGVLTTGADTDVVAIGIAGRQTAARTALPVPLVAIHGDADTLVARINSAQLVRQYLALNGHPAAASGAPGDLPPPDHETVAHEPDGRAVATAEWRIGTTVVARRVLVGELGHAWSGGDKSLPYNDARPPDATALLFDFVAGRP